MKALLAIACSRAGRMSLPGQVAIANGATDLEVHDRVLIAAAFCMFNRYVYGLATTAPTDQDIDRQRAKNVIANGYSAKGTTY